MESTHEQRDTSTTRQQTGRPGTRTNILPAIFEPLTHWVPMAITATVLAALIYLAMQQHMRLSANDPQIQLAEDAAVGLTHGAPPEGYVTQQPVHIAESLAPFVIVWDETGRPRASGALLDGQVPLLPAGVFAYARTHIEERVTWQPRPGVRIAAIIKPYAGTSTGFVLAGRSLREVELRETQLLAEVVVAWLIALGASLCAVVALALVTRRLRGHV